LDAYELDREIPEEKKKELKEDWKNFSREFEKLYDLASFQLSSKAVDILDEYDRKKKAAQNSKDLYECIDNEAAATIDCLKKLSVEAKCDLKIK